VAAAGMCHRDHILRHAGWCVRRRRQQQEASAAVAGRRMRCCAARTGMHQPGGHLPHGLALKRPILLLHHQHSPLLIQHKGAHAHLRQQVAATQSVSPVAE